MAQHDYVIDNSTGANVRADINSVLQAIASSNSGSSAPSTTYAFQLFANTTTSKLQIRNAANSAFVDLIGLDGTILLADGSASSPSLAFSDDLNTGIFSSSSDVLNFSTAGTERLHLAGGTCVFNEDGADVDFRIEGDTDVNNFYLDASTNRIGIGQSVPEGKLHIENASSGASYSADGADILIIENSDSVSIDLRSPSSNGCGILMSDNDARARGAISYTHSNDAMSINTAGSERMRIDSSGRLLIGTSSPRAFNTHNGRLQIEGTNYSSSTVSITNNTNDSNGAFLFFMKQRSGSSGGNTAANSGDIIGELRFNTADGTNFDNVGARIQVLADGSVSSDNTPTRMVFQTNSGTTSPTERMRINSSGRVLIGESTTADFDANLTINVGGTRAAITTHSGTTANRHALACCNDNGHVGGITTSGSATSFNTSSDYRLKENATAISDGITRLKTLKPYRFNFKADASTTVDGFFAHEVTAVPEAISGEKDAVKEDGSIDPQGIDQSKLVPLLVAAVQELIGKVEALEAA